MARILFIFQCFIAIGCSAMAKEDRPNFIVIFCDNLGYGDIEPFAPTPHRTPELNRMAAEGRKFTNFYVTSGVCTPSRASLITGCYAQRVSMHYTPRDGVVLRPISPFGLNPEELTIAEVLKEQGYTTACIGKWHLGDQPEFLPTRQGFDTFFGVPYSDDMTERVWDVDGSKWPPLPLMSNETVIEAPCDRNELTKRYTLKAMEWIAEHKEEPFFLYLPHAMPGSTHAPFASEAFRGKSANGGWGDSIEELDWSIGLMMDQLQELGIADNTLVVWTSDNGAPSNADLKDISRGTNLPLHGRLGYTSEGAFRVPAIVWQPGKVPAGTTCDELTTTMDLLPTFAKLAGRETAFQNKIDGHDVSALMYGEPNAKSPYEAFFFYQKDQLQAVRSGPWKLYLPVVPTSNHPFFNANNPPQDLLFNVAEDLGCKHNVASEHPEIVAQLKALAQKGREDLGDADVVGSGQRSRGRIPESVQPVPQLLQSNALNVIESERGGRHWAKAEVQLPKSAEESLASMKIEPGFEIQLYASEPLVFDPVSMAFDEMGRMFVVEYGDYPNGPIEGEDPLSKVVMLEDADHDGIADTRHVFADKLDFAHSLMPYDGGILVGAKTKILFLKDTDGDHVADMKEVWFEGFQPAHAQMQIGNPCWGIDNWVYLNFGPGKVSSRAKPKVTVELPRKDFRFNPRTMEFGHDSGLGQFANTIDRWGQRYYGSNRNPIMTTFLSPSIIARNPYFIPENPSYDVADAGGDTRVFPLVEMNSNYRSHAGTHTAACGTTFYAGEFQFGNLQDSVFVCEPVGHLVTRSIVRPKGLKLRAERAQPDSDFIASTDAWFSPSNLTNGPDGALYLSDMYRMWVEHPKFLPPEVAATLDSRAGEDRGRIYRIVPKDASVRRFTPPRSNQDAVELLSEPSSWRRFLGQRLLVERKAVDVVDSVRLLSKNGEQATTRLHALWTIDGLSLLEPSDVLRGLSDPDIHVQLAALQLAVQFIDAPEVLESVIALADAEDIRVRLGVALSLAGSDEPVVADKLASLAIRDGEDPFFMNGLMTSLANRSGIVLQRLMSHADYLSAGNQQRIKLVRALASTIGARGDKDELRGLITTLAEAKPGSDWWVAAATSGLGDGLPRHQGSLGRVTLVSLLAQPPAWLSDSVEKLKLVFERARDVAVDTSRPVVDRLPSIELLGYQPVEQVGDDLKQLLANDQPIEIQTACMQALSGNSVESTAPILLEQWPSLSPTVRAIALEWLLRRVESTRMALEAMTIGRMATSSLSIDQRVRLLKHTDTSVREMATHLFGGAVSANRSHVAKEYEKAVSMTGSSGDGAKVFARTCANCHRFTGLGHDVGPDLTDLKNRSKVAILYEVLDPNAKVEPNYTAYSVLTLDGTVYNGLVESETEEAIVLKMAEGKRRTIGRAEIEQFKVSDVSLMPEGIEKDISLQNMADLLEYLTSK